MRAMGDAGIASQPCTVNDLIQEVRAGVGTVVLAEEAMAKIVRKLAAISKEQPIWSDVPLIVVTAHHGAGAYRRLFHATPAFGNATLLERPMRVETLLQAVKAALGAREKQYHLRDEISERERLLARSRTNEQQLSAVLNNTRMAVFFVDDGQRCTFMNAAAEKLTGYSFAEIQGQLLHDAVHHTYPDGRPYPLHDCPIDRAFPEYNQTQGEEVFVHKDGHFYPVAFTASPIRQEGVAVGTVLEVRDITKQKADTERLHMLLHELNHRVKNTLVNVQSIFLQTLQGEAISDHARDAVMSRLMSLSRSHDLLTERNWVSAPLRDVVRRALAPFGATEEACGRFLIAGDEFMLNPQPALAIAMGLHELATNAVKYGSLSMEGGSVDLSWKLIPGEILRLRWVERGGPSVAEPRRSGFGRRLIERGLAHELAGESCINFHPDGVICEVDIPTATTMVAEERGIIR